METRNKDFRLRFVSAYTLLFYVLALYKLWNGMWLFQLQPQFFNTRPDGITWLFMQTGIHQLLLSNRPALHAVEIAFYTLPALYLLANRGNTRRAAWLAGLMLAINWIYVQCYTLYPANSIEGQVGWLLYPFVFLALRPEGFRLLTEAMRYYFLFFIASAGLWKFVQGGLFYAGQMSGILLLQHKEFLVAYPQHWYSNFIYYIIRHERIGYFLYIIATLLEVSFLTGFFTRRYDRVLLILLVLFLLMDYLVMRIPYFEILPLALPLWFSGKDESKPEPCR